MSDPVAVVVVVLTLVAIVWVAICAYFVRAAVRGTIRVRGKRFARSRQPRQFWTWIAFGFLSTGLVFVILEWDCLHWLFPKHIPALTTH